MLILKTSKQRFKKNFYTVLLEDGRRISCSDDIMVKYGISPGVDLDDNTLSLFIMEAQRSQAMDGALRLLSLQARSRKELADKLKAKKYDPAVIEAVLKRIAELGYLNDDTYARNRVSALIAQGKGPALITFDLRRKGIASAVVNDLLAEASRQPGQDPLYRVRDAAKKYLRRLKEEDPRVIARKLTGFLARRGFEIEDVRKILRELRTDQSDDDDTGAQHDQ